MRSSSASETPHFLSPSLCLLIILLISKLIEGQQKVVKHRAQNITSAINYLYYDTASSPPPIPLCNWSEISLVNWVFAHGNA